MRPGDIMTIKVEIEDASGISQVIGDIGGIDLINLSLAEGTIYNGTWYAQWLVHDTETRNYNTTITAINFLGGTSSWPFLKRFDDSQKGLF